MVNIKLKNDPMEIEVTFIPLPEVLPKIWILKHF